MKAIMMGSPLPFVYLYFLYTPKMNPL